MTDFHTHILPCMDDGARSPQQSEEMITALLRQGITRIAATPHYNSHRESPEQFITRRECAFRLLRDNCSADCSSVRCGAEVMFFDGMSHCDEVRLLRTEGTNLLLLEMPFSPWTNRMTEELLTMQNNGYTVILAHIERYLSFIPKNVLPLLARAGILIQANADFFTGTFSSVKAVRMMRNGQIHILGSDCHNMTTRSPENFGKALGVIEKKFGKEKINDIRSLSETLFSMEKCK